ncbi:MAG: glycerol-3-phosphate 1-O-acyltransferase PlsY [Prevotellaceae bacterium]|jgi:glycerol-3-phosphate acyltransferase PlsY|nr:glycerol-3-phosphate 1-O-acyltransferase PlsY [Prevotellaceae bacterium]
MEILYYALLAVVAYLLGSIPSAVWVGKKFYHVDVRKHGSGNAGTTNVLRVLGAKAALPVFAIDIAKGLAAVLLVYVVPNSQQHPETIGTLKIAYGLLSIMGHMYPVFAAFRGGKGVATMLGIIIAIQPEAALIALSVFIVVFAATRYVSLGSMLGGLSFPISVVVVLHEKMLSVQIFSVFACLLLFYTHRKNIQRLLKGVEPKTTFKKKHV